MMSVSEILDPASLAAAQLLFLLARNHVYGSQLSCTYKNGRCIYKVATACPVFLNYVHI